MSAAQGAQVMSVPTKSASSALAPPGGQTRKVGVIAVVGVNAVAAAPVEVDVPAVAGSPLERLRPGGVASDMILVEGLSGENAEGGAMLTAPELVAVVVVAVEPVATALVAVGVEVVLGVVVGKGIAPETDAGCVPGGCGGAAVVVEDVALVVVVAAVCASAELALPASSAAVRASAPGLIAICARS